MPITIKKTINISIGDDNKFINIKGAKKDIEKAEKKAHKLSVTTKTHVNRYSK